MAEEKRKGLGRGLAALLGEDAETPVVVHAPPRGVRTLPIEHLKPGKFQPRRRMDDAPIQELAKSIGAKGILQPILARKTGDAPDSYEIIAGERRWRAAQLAGLHEVPVVVKDLTDAEALEVALIENLQRQDLTPLEEAEGYKRLMEEFAHTQEKLAETVGKSRSHVANMMRLLALPEPVKDMLQSGELTAGHARALLTASDPVQLARLIASRGMSVREAERMAGAGVRKTAARKAPIKDADTRALESDLAAKLGLKVEIRHRGSQGGTLTVHYTMLEQLDDVIARLSRGGAAAKAGISPGPIGASSSGASSGKPPGRIAVTLRPVKPTGTG
ncbi:MAG: ParB/RepB/Spo0J family partition protein [Rhodospirillales bacterium]|nr:ParB/RepB/Spo0J family partition protein [Rhodospirillales bacterium]